VARTDLTIIGSTGLNRAGGRVYEEYLRELAGDRWRRVLREMMDQDPVDPSGRLVPPTCLR
jgi:hypothetical protein